MKSKYPAAAQHVPIWAAASFIPFLAGAACQKYVLSMFFAGQEGEFYGENKKDISL